MYSLTAAVADLAARRCSSAELTDMLLAAERPLGAFSVLDADRARQAARTADRSRSGRPLHGIPVVVKDNIDVAGLPTTAGTPALRDAIAAEDAPAVRRLIEAGAFVLGKTTMHELAFGITGGPARNAVDPRRFAGGSSGGTAVAIAAGSAIAGLGSDTGGSVRIPAALNGICGLRPTHGRYPRGGTVPLAPSRDTIGPMAATVADLALLDTVLAADDTPVEPAPADTLTFGVAGERFLGLLDEQVEARWLAALDEFRSAGIRLRPVPLDGFERLERDIGGPIVHWEARRSLTDYLAHRGIPVSFDELVAGIASPDVRELFTTLVVQGAPKEVGPAQYRAAIEDGVPRLRRTYDALFVGGLDAVVFPTTLTCAQPVPDGLDRVRVRGRTLPTFGAFVRYTAPGSIAGIPGLTVPLGTVHSGLPVGLSLDGPAGRDRRLLGIGLTVQEILGRSAALE